MIFSANSLMYAGFERLYDANGRVWVEAIAHGTLVANTPYKLIANEFGPVSAALADDVFNYYVGVPAVAAVVGDKVRFQIGGPVAAMITPSLSVSVGHALAVLNGAVADAGGDYSGADGQFAVCNEASTTSTTQSAVLVPERIKGTT